MKKVALVLGAAAGLLLLAGCVPYYYYGDGYGSRYGYGYGSGYGSGYYGYRGPYARGNRGYYDAPYRYRGY